MTDTTDNDTIHGNAQVIDFGPALAARRAGKAPLDTANRVSFSINFTQWPLEDVRWLANRMDDMGGTLVAATLRKVAREAELSS